MNMASGQQIAKLFQRTFNILGNTLKKTPSGISCSCRVPGKKYQQGTFSVNRFLHTSTSLQKDITSQQKFSTAAAVQLQKEESSHGTDLVVSKVSDVIHSPDVGRLFAVIYIQGKQRKVTTEDLVVVKGHFDPTVGDKIRLEKVLLVGGKDFTLVGRPMLSRKQVKVEATVLEKTLSHFHVNYNYKPRRKMLPKFNLKRENYAVLLINSIEVSPVLDS